MAKGIPEALGGTLTVSAMGSVIRVVAHLPPKISGQVPSCVPSVSLRSFLEFFYHHILRTSPNMTQTCLLPQLLYVLPLCLCNLARHPYIPNLILKCPLYCIPPIYNSNLSFLRVLVSWKSFQWWLLFSSEPKVLLIVNFDPFLSFPHF